jgi:hypothetical protein
MRRLLSLYVALCLSVGASLLPTESIRLVCRMTGRPMTPVILAEGANSHPAGMPCCRVRAARGADGAVRYALAARSCCDLRIGVRRGMLPTAVVAPTVADSPIALAPMIALAVVPPLFTVTVPSPMLERASPPRAPPRPAALLRAPPFVS